MAAVAGNQNVAYSCLCFDEYRTEGRTPCVNGCISLTTYLGQAGVHLVARPPYQDQRTGSTMSIPGEGTNGPVELFTTERGKQFVHSLFAGVHSVVKDGKYFRRIAAENIYISPEGNVRFHDVEIMDEGNDIQRQNRARTSYHEACKIAIDRFTAQSTTWRGQIPCDINHLFARVMADKVLYNIGLYHIHMSLVPIAVGMLVFFKLYDHMLTTMPAKDRDTLLSKLYACQEFKLESDGVTLRWEKEAKENTLLRSIYMYENSANYIVTDKMVFKKTGINLHPKISTLVRDLLLNRTRVAVFLDFLRHRTAHRMQSWKLGAAYSPEQADYACLAKFRLFLAILQWELWIAPGFKFSDLNFSGFFGFDVSRT